MLLAFHCYCWAVYIPEDPQNKCNDIQPILVVWPPLRLERSLPKIEGKYAIQLHSPKHITSILEGKIITLQGQFQNCHLVNFNLHHLIPIYLLL